MSVKPRLDLCQVAWQARPYMVKLLELNPGQWCGVLMGNHSHYQTVYLTLEGLTISRQFDTGDVFTKRPTGHLRMDILC